MALRHMVLRDFAIVRALDLDLGRGFSVLTGETGAGKSILVDALQLALGARADAASVREGASRAEVSAEFDTPGSMRGWLEQAGFEAADTLLLRRAVDSQGRSRAWINGTAATATQLREAADCLVDIHGQHAWQSLMRPDAVRALLDAYAGVDGTAMLSAWQAMREAERTLAEARAAQDSLLRERERLQWQIGELARLAPQDGEWDSLNQDHGRLAHAQSLIEAAQLAIARLQGDDDGDTGALRALAQAQQAIAQQCAHAPEMRAVADVLLAAMAQAEDAAHTLHGWLRRTDLDPARLAQLDERMAQWMALARRYRRRPAELPALVASWHDELRRLDAAADLQALEQAARSAAEAFERSARAVSGQRQQAAPRLSQAITEAMQGLGMPGGRFEVCLSALPAPAAHGLDDIAFLVAGHAGSTPRPVAKVASGGELSRIALAIAVTTSALGQAQTLIFDEVDAGVGGAVAETVGRLMKQLGRDRQVLAVTHLPQVAACADAHLLVSKFREGEATLSAVRAVAGEQRVREIARMLGGERLSVTTLAHAREMLDAQAAG